MNITHCIHKIDINEVVKKFCTSRKFQINNFLEE